MTGDGVEDGARHGDPSRLPAAKRLSPSATILRGAAALLSTQPLTWAATLLTAVLLPRYLGDHGFGQYALALNVALLTGAVAALGVPKHLVRRVATEPARAEIEGGGALVLLGSVSLLTALGLSIVLSLLGFQISETALLPIALAGMVGTTAQSAVFSLLVGQERHARFAWFNAGAMAIGPCAGIGVLMAGGGVTGYMGTLAATSGIITALAWYGSGFRLHRGAFDVKLWKQLVRGGLPFLISEVTLRVRNQIDVILVGILLHEQVAGWLAAAYRIVSIPFFIPHLVVTPLLPALSRSAGNRLVFQQTLRRSIKIVLILTIPASAMLIALAPVVPDLLGWGPAFKNSVPLMMIIAVVQPLASLDMVLGTALFALNRERRWLGVAVIAATFNPGMNLLMLPLFEQWLHNGAIGAAVAEVVTELIMFVGSLILLPRGILDGALAWMAARLVLAAGCMAVVTMTLLAASLPLAVAAGGLAFLAVAAIVGVLPPGELRIIRDVLLESLARRPANARS